MSYLHCHNCGWEQDNFWNKNNRNYPIRQDTIEWLRDLLEKDSAEIQIDGSCISMDTREIVALELERMAKRIRNMKIKTYDEFKKIKDNFKCPLCKSSNYDID